MIDSNYIFTQIKKKRIHDNSKKKMIQKQGRTTEPNEVIVKGNKAHFSFTFSKRNKANF